MPKITSDMSKDKLREIAEKDIARISKTIQKDPRGVEHFWNDKIKMFESKAVDENGHTSVMGIDSSVKGYWHYCPELTGHNSKGYELKCMTPHFVFIYQDGEKLTCRKCKKENTIKLVIPK